LGIAKISLREKGVTAQGLLKNYPKFALSRKWVIFEMLGRREWEVGETARRSKAGKPARMRAGKPGRQMADKPVKRTRGQALSKDK